MDKEDVLYAVDYIFLSCAKCLKLDCFCFPVLGSTGKARAWDFMPSSRAEDAKPQR